MTELSMHLNNLAISLIEYYREKGDRKVLEEAIELLRQAAGSTKSGEYNRPFILNNLSSCLVQHYLLIGDLQNLQDAIAAGREAVRLTPTNSPDLPTRLNNLAASLLNYFRHRQQPEDLIEVIDCFQRAIALSPTDSPYQLSYLSNLGSAFLENYVRFDRQEDLDNALDIFEKVQIGLDRAFLFSPVAYQLGQQIQWTDFYSQALQAYLVANLSIKAMVIAEGSKSRLLTSLMSRKNLPAPSSIPTSMAEQEEVLAEELANLDAQALAQHGHGSPDEEKAILKNRQEMIDQLLELWLRMEKYGPKAIDYVALRRGDHLDWQGLVQLSSKLGPETAIISLFTTVERIFLFIKTEGEARPAIVEIPLSKVSFEDLVQRFYREVHCFDGWRRRGETWANLLRARLIEAAPLLKGVKRIVVVPHAWGHLLPWGVLAWQAGWEAAIVTIPALSLMERVLAHQDGSKKGALVVGNPTDDLPYAEEEARQVAEILKTEPLIRGGATIEAVMEKLTGAEVVHFASHAYFESGSPLDSGIVLADGILTVREIFGRGRYSPFFIALSACETGLSKSLGGDELAGMSQALLYAGARSLLVSLWKVNDLATAYLMTRFYRDWQQEGNDKATALKRAMTATRNCQDHPEWENTYYWGSFLLVGDWR